MNWKLLACVVIIAIIIVVLFIVVNKWRKKNNMQRLLFTSNGTFDNSAKEALSNALDEQSPENTFIAGEIIDLNMMEANMEENAANVIANLYRIALNGIIQGANFEIYPREFIVDRIDDFTQRNRANAEEFAANIFIMDIGDLIDDIPIAKAKLASDRIEEAAAISTNKADALKEYFDISATHTSDDQNVHDSAVNENLRKTYEILKREAKNVATFEDTKKEITEYVNNKNNNSSNKGGNSSNKGGNSSNKNALRALNFLTAGGELFVPIGVNERVFLTLVWNRASLKQNADVSDNIKLAVVNALADFYKNDDDEFPICCGGRSARILESLTAIDNNNKLGGSMTREMFRNEIFGECQSVIKKVLKDAETDDKAEIRMAAKSYEDPKIVADEKAETEIKARQMREIEKIIQKYSAKLGERDVDDIRKDCTAAIMSF